MPSGVAAAGLANPWLSILAGTTFTAPATTYVGLHVGEPGPAGTGNLSSVTTRPAITWGTAVGGAIGVSAPYPSWASWAGTNGEILTNVSIWTASTSGTFLFSVLLTTPKTAGTSDILTLASLSLAVVPIAA